MLKYRFVDVILLGLIIVAVDQYTKWYAVQHLTLHTPVIVNKFFNWYLDYNKGAAFSLFNQGLGWQRWVLAGFSALVCIIILVVLKNTSEPHISSKAGLILIFGGALGNLIDRAFSGVVTDFIQWHIGTYYWPTFNLADSAVVIGVVFFLWGMR